MKEPFNKIKRGSLYQEVADILREAIISRRYRPGEPLPSEMELSKQFGVSRNVVREAIRSLQSRGFLKVRRGPKGGAFVSKLESTIAENLSDLISVRYVSVEHLMQVRMHLEPEVMRLAALHATDEDLDVIGQVLEEADAAREAGDDDRRITLNTVFHRAVGKACGNPFFAIVVDSIMDFTERFVKSESINPYRTDVHRHGEHREIFNAIRDRDPEKTRKLAAEHIARLAEATKGWEKDYLERSKEKSGQLTP